MLDPLLRPVKDHLLRHVARAAGARLHPTVVTLASLAAGLGAAALAWRGAYGVALGLWLANRVLDGFDGVLARERGLQSDRGGYLDLLADFVVYALIPVALVAGRPAAGVAIAALWLLASFYVNAMSWMYIAAVLERRGQGAAARGEQTSIAMPESLVGGTETILFYSAFLLFPSHLTPLFTAMAVLTAAGVVHRTGWAWRRL